MSAESKALVRRLFQQVWNEKNLEVLEQLCAGDGQLQRRIEAVLAAFPDNHSTVEDIVAEEDKVVLRWIAQATHQGEFMGHPPSGRRVSVTGISIFHVGDDKIEESWTEWDALSLLRQISEEK
jgi:steroid delta-isomerase-like uncharacterized protein